MKVYVSSTLQDLREHRAAVDRVLRQMGHDVIGMEQYVAEATTPVSKVRADVRSADVYVVIVGWRYGHVPETDDNPGRLSITELEYVEAEHSVRTTVLAFLLDPEAPWPPSQLDALAPGGDARIRDFRSRLGTSYLAGVFRTPDQLASQVAAAIARQGINRQMLDRSLGMESLSDSMSQFAHGAPMEHTSGLGSIELRVGAAAQGTVSAFEVNLAQGDAWWSTRLFLLAVLCHTLTPVRQFVFTHADGSFAGMASPAAVRDGLSSAFPALARVDAALMTADAGADVRRELDRVLGVWRELVVPEEAAVQVGVRMPLLRAWLGERLVTRCVQIDPEQGLTMAQVQQIVESLLPDVPVERLAPDGRPGGALPGDAITGARLMVVDRDAFALQLARQWVAASLPRTAIV